MAGSSDSEGESGVESRGKMVKRHKKELLAAQKAQKALGKKRADEGAALVAEVNARHAAELAALDAGPAGEAAAAPAAHLSEPPAVAGVASATAALAAAALSEPASAASDAGGKVHRLTQLLRATQKPSKAQQRRAKQAKEEAEREQRIAEEKSNMGDSSRVIEENALMAKLSPLNFLLHEIKADGHCLYRSLEDQVALEHGGVPPAGRDYLGLRAAAASYMRSHPDEYAPFVVDGDAEGCEEGGDSFERYCRNVEATAAWGGQLELRALAHVMRRRIVVYSAHLPTVEMGEEYRVEEHAPPLRVAYQRAAYSLGEHYNSVRQAAPDAAAGDSD